MGASKKSGAQHPGLAKRFECWVNGAVTEEHTGREVIWQIAARRSTYKKHGKRSALYEATRKIEKAKAQVRAKVEHPFRVIKRQFGHATAGWRRTRRS